MEKIGLVQTPQASAPNESFDYYETVFGFERLPSSETSRSTVTDNEHHSTESTATALADRKLLEDATELVKNTQKIERDKSEGTNPSDSLLPTLVLDIVQDLKSAASNIVDAMSQEAQRREGALNEAKTKVDRAAIGQLVQQAHAATAPAPESRGWLGLAGAQTRQHPAIPLLEGRSQAEREVFKEVFQTQFGQSAEQYFGQQPGGDRLVRMLSRNDLHYQDIPADKLDETFKRAEALHSVLSQSDLLGRPTINTTTLFGILEKLEPAERRALTKAFKEVSGKDLHDVLENRLTGSDEERALNYLDYGSSDVTGQVHLGLTRDHDQDLRDSLRTMTSGQIAALDRQFIERFGKNLRDSITDNDELSQNTKLMLDIYLKGADKRTNEDWDTLINIALGANKVQNQTLAAIDRGDLKLLAEVMSSKVMPAEFRQKWLEDGGRQKLQRAFPSRLLEALDYAQHGFLTTATKLDLNTDCGIFGNDDEDGIERALAEMPDTERALYLRGARIDAELGKLDLFETMQRNDALSTEERNCLRYFNRLQQKIESPADGGEYDKWTDMAIRRGGSERALAELKNITANDWELLRDPLQYGEHMKKLLAEKHIDLMSLATQKRALAFLEEVSECEIFEDIQRCGSASIVNLIQDTTTHSPAERLYIMGQDKLAMVTAVATSMHGQRFHVPAETVLGGLRSMNLEDRRKYKNDEKFRESVDRWVALALQGNETHTEAALSLQAKLREGKTPRTDFIDEINIEAGNSETNEARVIRLIEYEFRKSEASGEKPTLRERLSDPQTEAERTLKVRFDTALHRALEDDEYKQYALPLLQNGHVDLEFMLSIHKAEDHDRKKRFEEITELLAAKDPVSQADRQRFLSDVEYQKRVLDYLPTEVQAVTLNVLRQGEMRTEDITRAMVLGLGPEKDAVMSLHSNLSAANNEKFRSEYARKYGSDIVQNLAGKLEGKDETRALREIRRDPKTSQEAYYDARQDAYAARSGWGSDFTDCFSGLGYMVDNSVAQMGAKVEETAVTGKELSRQEIRILQENIYDTTEAFVETKEAVANAVVDVALTGISIAIPGGLSLRTALLIGAGGGAGKVAFKTSFMGENYDSGSVAKDFASGFVEAATSTLAPGQIARVAGVGRKAALEATQHVVSSTGKSVLKEGAEGTLGKEVEKLVAKSIADGSYVISDKAIDKLVRGVVKDTASEAEIAALRESVKGGLETALKGQMKPWLKQKAVEYALEVPAGAIGAGAGGVTKGVFEWDFDKSVQENLAAVLESGLVSAAFGAMGTAGIKTGISGAGAGVGLARRIKNGTKARGAHSDGPDMTGHDGRTSDQSDAGDHGSTHSGTHNNSSKPKPDSQDGSLARSSSDDVLNQYQKGLQSRFQDNPSSTPSPEELKKFFDDLATPDATRKMVRGAIDDAEKQATIRITEKDYERLGHLTKEAGRKRLSPADHDELKVLEARFETIKKAYKDKTGQALPDGQLVAALRQQPLNAADRAHAEALSSAWKNVKTLTVQYNELGDDLAAINADLRKLQTPEGTEDVMARFRKFLAYRGVKKPKDGEAPVQTPLDRGPSMVKGYLEAEKEGLEMARNDIAKQMDSGLQAVEEYLASRKGKPNSDGVGGGLDSKVPSDAKQAGDNGANPSPDGVDRVPTNDRHAPPPDTVEHPAILPTPQEVQRFLDDLSSPGSTSMMTRGVIDDVEGQTGRRITQQDHDRLLALRQRADHEGLSLSQDRELNALEHAFANIRRLYAERTGQALPREQLIEALGQHSLTGSERAHAEALYLATKSVKIAETKYARLGDDLAVTAKELQNLDTPTGVKDLLGRIEKDESLAQHLFHQAKVPSEIQDLIRSSRAGARNWSESRARAVLKSHLETHQDVLRIARDSVDRQRALGLQNVESYLIGRKLRDHAVENFLSDISSPDSISMMARGVIDDAEKQLGTQMTKRDYERLVELRQESARGWPSLETDAELEVLEQRFRTIRRLYKDRTGQAISGDQLSAALERQKLTPDERVQVEVLSSATKNVKVADAKYIQYRDDLAVTTTELQKLDSPTGATELIERIEKDKALAGHLFDDGRVPADVQKLIVARGPHGHVVRWSEDRARAVLKSHLEAQKASLEIAKDVMARRRDLGRQEVEAHLFGRSPGNSANNPSAAEPQRTN